eukprot:c18421_g1_i1.p1 GENE.c18421_g1_i1~~c18421_g1_i1.p1  ORF type:complete len:660 (+),score=191.77 c18421_g1_i1:250-1980(+)
MTGNYGMAHLRWATHGVPSDVNAHPHLSNNKKIVLVHNGAIENESVLRKQLEKKGFTFQSQTDSEVLANLIQNVMDTSNVSLRDALPLALRVVAGAFGVMVVSRDEPGVIIGAQSGSPLLVGEVGNGKGFFLTSTATALPPQVTNLVPVHDAEYVVVSKDKFEIKTFDQVPVVNQVLEWQAFLHPDKGEYPDFILKEIMDQPQALRECFRGRLSMLQSGDLQVGGLGKTVNGKLMADHMCEASRVILIGSGSSFNAALLGKYLIESFARIPCQAQYASEFCAAASPFGRFSKPPVLIAISQSGETGDVVASIKLAKEQGILTFGIVNVPNSSISRLTDAGLFMRAGQEMSVTSTKSFTLSVAVLTILSIALGRKNKNLSDENSRDLLSQLAHIPDQIDHMLEANKGVFPEMARTYRYATNFLYLGRGFNYPIVLEGALKLTQLVYIHCEAYPAAEMKHGPIALIDDFMPVLFVAMKDAVYDKVVSNIQEVRARRGAVIAITDAGNRELDKFCDFVINIPPTHDMLLPLLTVIPLQMLAYELGIARKCSVEAPRHQAKYFANEPSRTSSFVNLANLE